MPPDPPPDYLQRVQQAIGGQAAALEWLLQQHRHDVQVYIQRQLPPDIRPLLDPQDILQDVFFDAFRRIGSFVPDQPDAFLRWLLTIARHRLIDLARHHRAMKRGSLRTVRERPATADSTIALLHELRTYERTPSASALSGELVELLRQSIAHLPSDHRRVIQLHFLEGRPVPEVAATLHRTPGAIHMLCQRSLKTLRGKLFRLLQP